MSHRTINKFTRGIHNTLPEEAIPDDAFSAIYGWLIKNNQLELARGRVRVGADAGVGSCSNVHVGYRTDGTPVRFRKQGTVIQYYDGSAWQNVITGLTAGAPTRFSNYSSLAGAFVYIFSSDGIYKICTANPGNFASLYDATKNFKGVGFIDKGRTILWGRELDPTGLYGSYIDTQTAVSGSTGVYTTVSGEAITDVASGTLAFKAGGATRTCFAVQITDTSSGEVFTDNFNGILTGSLGSTGTINYMTGAFTITGQSGAGTATYQWENSNLRGVTDFSKSATRVAGEGFVFRQDIGGDAIKLVIPLEGSYYSMKERSIYRLAIDPADTTATNEVFRVNVGTPSSNAATATSKGIMLLDTANGETPTLRVITRNPIGDNFDIVELFEEFDFSDYVYDDLVMFTYGDYILLACKSRNADANDTVIMCNFVDKTITTVRSECLSFAQEDNILLTGDSVSANTYEFLTGFDDLGNTIENSASTKLDDYGLIDLKKTKKIRLTGLISVSQHINVYITQERGLPILIGTIDGDADYVDKTNPTTVGSNLIGSEPIGGSSTTTAYPFFTEIKVRLPKFLKRKLTFVATNIGYAAIQTITDFDIWRYEAKLPKKYRLKQNVDINDSTITNQ